MISGCPIQPQSSVSHLWRWPFTCWN